jgi:hypothetical protein
LKIYLNYYILKESKTQAPKKIKLGKKEELSQNKK